MKTIQLTPTEFKLFQKLADQMQIIFMYIETSNGMITVEAGTCELEGLGY